MKNKTSLLSKSILMAAIICAATLSLLLALSSIDNSAQLGEKCFVPPGQTVVAWKSLVELPCSSSAAGICAWPISHRHLTYKVTVGNGTPLRDENGKVIPATNGYERGGWTIYDSAAWNMLEYIPTKDRYINFEPIASNEYVVMVETRYRLLNNVESTLGICMQQP